MPTDLKQYISTWKKTLPDYEIIEWNLENWTNLEKYPFVKECLDNEMYAHASDVIRLDVLLHYGGIYLDTDVSIHQSFDPLLTHNLFIGRIYRNLIGTAVIGSEKNNQVIKKMLAIYENLTLMDLIGSKKYDTNNSTFTYFLLDNYHDFKLTNINQTLWDGTTILKKEYFEHPSLVKSKNYSIHHYKGSWRKNKKSVFERIKGISKIVIPAYLYGQISSIRGAKKNKRFDKYRESISADWTKPEQQMID